MQAAWKVPASRRSDKARVVETEKLDYELFDRWLALPREAADVLSGPEAVAGDDQGAAARRRRRRSSPTSSRTTLVDVMLAQKEVKEENDIIRAKALPGTKKKEPANLPNEFITNDDFCPGCGLELKSHADRAARTCGPTSSSAISTASYAVRPDAKAPALLLFSGWGLERQLGADRRALIEALRDDIEAMQKAHARKVRLHPRRAGRREARRISKIAMRGNPYPARRRGAARIPDRAAARASRSRSPRAAAGSSWPTPSCTSRSRCASSSTAIWKGHFGTGIVDTPSNFGKNGERPTHPELLEYLAQSFVDHGMSIKELHREIMLSAVYQLERRRRLRRPTSRRTPATGSTGAPIASRMSAEQIRDSVLFGVRRARHEDGRTVDRAHAAAPTRRTVYGNVSRYRLDEFLQLFDFPSAESAAEKRFATTVPLQRLFFMNSDFMQQQAEQLAERVAREPTDEARIQKAYELIFGRAPTPAEVRPGCEFLRAEPMRQYEEQEGRSREGEGRQPDGTRLQTPTADNAEPDARGPAARRAADARRDRHDGGRGAGRRGGDDDGKEPLPVTVVRPVRQGAAQFERVPVR